MEKGNKNKRTGARQKGKVEEERGTGVETGWKGKLEQDWERVEQE